MIVGFVALEVLAVVADTATTPAIPLLVALGQAPVPAHPLACLLISMATYAAASSASTTVATLASPLIAVHTV